MGQEGQGAPWEEGEVRPAQNFEDEVIRQLGCGKAPKAEGVAHVRSVLLEGNIWRIVNTRGVSFE